MTGEVVDLEQAVLKVECVEKVAAEVNCDRNHVLDQDVGHLLVRVVAAVEMPVLLMAVDLILLGSRMMVSPL